MTKQSIGLFVLLLITSFASKATQKTHYLCVFDPVGRNGDIYSVAKDIALDFLNLGVKLNLYPYSTESAAKADFRAGLCDAVALTGIQAREYNRFSTTLEAFGAIENYSNLKKLLSTLAQPKAGKLFLENGLEVAGIYPAGAVYMYSNDKNIKRPQDFSDKRFFVSHGEKTGYAFVDKLGAQPVAGDTTNFASRFKRGRVDVTFSPAAVTEALELDKGMEEKGGVIKLPVWMLTLQVIIKPEKFDKGFGQQARELSLDYFDKAISIATASEQKLAPYWVELNDADHTEWQYFFKQVRDDMEQAGVYDSRMLRLLKRLKCTDQDC